MRKSLFPQLAASGLKKNGRLFYPYLIACTLCVMMFYIMVALTGDPALRNIPGGGDVGLALSFGCVVVAIFSAIILFYTNSALAKGRRREFGLYNVLGMEKRHVGRVILWEMALSAGIALPLGLISGVVFAKLMQMVLLRLLGGKIGFDMTFSAGAAGLTLALFCAIFFLIFLNNLRILNRLSPVELLRATGEGEREPKSKRALAGIGLVCLASGYALSIMTKSAVGAILLFFVAVLFVIAGTYFSFTAFSIVFLKRLKKRKSYYYTTRHFATVSGMLYRMKRNAAGLASICILSTMVLVTVSTTVSLYLGAQGIIDGRYPYDISMGGDDLTEMEETAKRIVSEQGLEMANYAAYPSLSFTTIREGSELVLDAERVGGMNMSGVMPVWITTEAGYESMTGEDISLADGEMLCRAAGERPGDEITLLGKTYRLAFLDEFPYDDGSSELGFETLFLVVDTDKSLAAIEQAQKDAYGSDASAIQNTVRFDLTGTDEQKLACANALTEATKTPVGDHYVSRVQSRQYAIANDFFSFYGAFFFLGMFLGLMFILATVLIIYYKQISEGYDDRARFSILRKVGMTDAEIRATIRQQVLTVFFLPLGTAGLHIAFAFPMVRRVLSAFGMTDIPLFLACTASTFAVFALLYTIVYLITARTYYGIVGNSTRIASNVP